MTPEKFLQNLLDSQNLSPEQEKNLQSHKTEVTNFLRTEFGQEPVIKYAGSYEKGTLISDRYDLDIVCYFPSSDIRSLKDIRDDVATHLAKRYITKPKASAERILDLKGASEPIDFHIDVVPGRFIQNTKDVFLHVASGDKERMQTNLKTHIDYIKNSGCVPIIRLVKIWADRNNLTIKTFVLELFVIQALSGSQNKTNLKESFIKVLHAFRDDFGSTQLIDPANSANMVSQSLTSSEKTSVKQIAETTIKTVGTSDVVKGWQDAFHANISTINPSTAGLAYTVGNSFQPNRPWGDYDNGN